MSFRGFKDWPENFHPQALTQPMREDRAWPKTSVTILTPTGSSPDDIERTRLSILRQDHPDVEIIEAPYAGDAPVERAQQALLQSFEKTTGDYHLVLAPGEMLAPGALSAACLWLDLYPADILTGLRIIFQNREAVHIDVSAVSGKLTPQTARAWMQEDGHPFSAGEIFFRRAAMHVSDMIGGHANPVMNFLEKLAERQGSVARLARPFLLAPARDCQDWGSGAAKAKKQPAFHSLKIAALNDLGFGVGGASIADRRFIDALRLAGHHVDLFVLAEEAAPVAAEWTMAFPKTEEAIKTGGYDLVIVGNVHAVVRNADFLSRINVQTPVAVLTHDLFMATGRCSVAPCNQIYAACGKTCPSPSAYPYLASNRIAAAWDSKRRFFHMQPPPMVLANSAWSADFFRSVLGPDCPSPIHAVTLAFPSQVFRPQNRRHLRIKLGLPLDDFLIVSSSVVSDNDIKGGPDLFATLKAVAGPGVGFVIIGRVDNPKTFADLPNHYSVGLVADEERLADYYAACDAHVTASRYETLGQTPVEVGLSGVPTIGYRSGGLSSAINHGVSGLLVEPDTEPLQNAIKRLRNDEPLRRSLETTGRIWLEANNNYAASYLSLYPLLCERGLIAPSPRIAFSPELLRAFAGAENSFPGAKGLVGKNPSSFVRMARRLKKRIFGERLPLFFRKASYLLYLLRV